MRDACLQTIQESIIVYFDGDRPSFDLRFFQVKWLYKCFTFEGSDKYGTSSIKSSEMIKKTGAQLNQNEKSAYTQTAKSLNTA